jgi:CDP-glucose 4,6-dehydratase|tara:strand:+ start:869 stop:1945 length:1077 start_codon:yes stop_codon:yes gene_type:complete
MINKNFWKGKKVLVTGHTGFKGGWLSIWLKVLGAKVYGLSLNPSSNPNFFQVTKIKNIFEKDVRENIQKISSLKKLVNIHKPQIIFHLAAQPQVLESYNDPMNTIKTNVIGTTNLLESIKNKKFVKSVVIITTDKVYKNLDKEIKFDEDSCLGGDDVYSSSKAAADIISLSYIKSFFNKTDCNLSTVRAGNCIGGGDWTKYRVLTDSTKAFMKNKNLLIRNPDSKRPWQHVLEPLSGYILLAQKLYGKKGKNFCGSWNFGPKRKSELKVLDFVKILKKKMSSSSKIVIKKDKEKLEKMTLDLSSKKANTLLKWKSFLSIDKTLSLTAEWYLANKNKKNMLKVTTNQINEYQYKFNQKN